jgi:hypothetical protein
VLRPEERDELSPAMAREEIGDVTKLSVYRRRIANDADTFAVEGG